MSSTGDLILIREIKRDSHKHFKLLYEQYWFRLFSIARNTLNTTEEAEDVVQEIFIDIWKRRHALKVDNVSAYLFTCVRYGIAKRLKKYVTHKQEELFESIKHADNLEESIDYADLLMHVQTRIETLPERCRKIFELSRYSQLSNKEIAQKLNISVSTVENQINKALKTLKEDPCLSKHLTYSLLLFLFS